MSKLKRKLLVSSLLTGLVLSQTAMASEKQEYEPTAPGLLSSFVSSLDPDGSISKGIAGAAESLSKSVAQDGYVNTAVKPLQYISENQPLLNLMASYPREALSVFGPVILAQAWESGLLPVEALIASGVIIGAATNFGPAKALIDCAKKIDPAKSAGNLSWLLNKGTQVGLVGAGVVVSMLPAAAAAVTIGSQITVSTQQTEDYDVAPTANGGAVAVFKEISSHNVKGTFVSAGGVVSNKHPTRGCFRDPRREVTLSFPL
jgi:hypothetical protein